MSLKNFFSKGDKTKHPQSIEAENITVEILKTLIPIRSLSIEKLESFATDRKAERYPAKSILFNQGDQADCAYYLLSGKVSISDDAGKNYEVEAHTAKAKFPLSSGIKHTLKAEAKTDVSILRVSQKIMSMQPSEPHHSLSLNFPAQLSNSHLIQTFSQNYMEEDIPVPSMPDVALKLRKAMEKDIGIAEAVKIIQFDPVIAAKLIQVANCPLYVTVNPAKTCLEAVNRIGLKATQNLVISLCIKDIFQAKNSAIKKLLESIWRQSVYVSCISYVLAAETKIVNPEEALLAGLICDIGLVPFLTYAANLPDNYYTKQELIDAIPYIRGPVGMNILREWDFPEELVVIPSFAENWYQHTQDKLSLIDIVVLSRLHSKIGTADMAQLPAITSIPAASKLDHAQLSPENSLHILHNAQNKINEAKRAFSI